MLRTLTAVLLLSAAGVLWGQDPLAAARRLKQEGSAAAAAKAYEAALPALRKAGDKSMLAHALLEYSQTSLAAGAYAQTLAAARESAPLFQSLHDAPDEASADNAAGSAQLSTGDYAGAVQSFQHALAIDRKSGDARGEITRLSNIGNVYFFEGRYLDAESNYQAAFAKAESTRSEPWNGSRRELVLTNLATLYEQLGQNDRALGYYQQALADAEQMPVSERAQLLSNAGTLYRRLGDGVKALETYRAAQALYRQQQLSDGEIHVLQNIGLARALDMADLPGAEREFTGALRLAQASANRREETLAYLFRAEALYRMGRLPEAGDDFSAALAAARSLGAVEEQWTSLDGLARIARAQGDAAEALARFREAIALIESLRSGLERSSLKAEFLANKRRVYDGAIDVMLSQPGLDSAHLFAILEQARARNLQDALRGGPIELKTIQAKLKPGSVLLEYWLAGRNLAALWATSSTSGFWRKTLPDDADVADLSKALRAPGKDWRAISERWGTILLGGIPLSAQVKQLLIVPDGALAEVPFEALDSAQVVRRFAVSYLPSASLLTQTPGRRRVMPWQQRLIAFGDPLVDSGTALPGDTQWSKLPDAARELEGIRTSLPGRTLIHAASDDRKRYLLEKSAVTAPLLHLSTHASVDLTDPGRSRILFTHEQGQPGSQYLFQGELQSLKLRDVDLVTLSACDTERGKLTPGEGVQGFSRAFLAAGAHSTVTTLWRAADGPSADLMRVFYQHLGRGESKAQSLRAAKLAFLDSHMDLEQPVFWAPFILTGDGQMPIPPAVPWWWLAAPILLICALIALYRRTPRSLRRHPRSPRLYL